MCLAVAGELVEINDHPDPLWRMGEVSFGGVLRQVSLACLPEARIGDRLMVHVGLALAVLDGGPTDGLDGEMPP
jgi:hydrogenase expression/formation protein HypC